MPVNAPPVNDLAKIAAARDLCDTWAHTKAWEREGEFTCAEADALAELLRAFGYATEADESIQWHSYSDTLESDTHHYCDPSG